ncbi:MAG: hypothetical protein LUD19_04690 [Clostridia bacterium]|nr:hypothetical protein [Clostridia bacterium]
MKRLNLLKRSKRGAVLATAVIFMAVAVSLCAMVTTYILLMSKTSSAYKSLNQTKLAADEIVAAYKNYLEEGSTFYGSYGGCTAEYTLKSDGVTEYTCTVYKDGEDKPVLTAVLVYESSSGTYKYSGYEYGNI